MPVSLRPLRVCVLLLLALLSGACSKANNGLPDFATLVEDNSASVVNISAVAVATAADIPEYDEQTPEWFRRYLEKRAAPADGAGDGAAEPAEPEPEPLGSGFVLWENGYILTNYHVVEGAGKIIVRLLDRRELPAQLVGVDRSTDLALLKIDAKGLQAVRIGDSQKLRPGQWVFAIGSPFSFDFSVTAGIVSAKGRSLHTEQYVPFIQTDVAINPGNSGGPLFNLEGEVVGINSQIYSQSGSFQGVSFSIPIDIASRVAVQLRDKGRVTRGWLGVVVQEVDGDLAQSFNMERAEGALISRIMPNSPAQESGLKPGDVIVSFNGEPLPISGSLPPLVGRADPGQVLPLEVIRGGERLKFQIEVGVLQEDPSDVVAQPSPRPEPAADGALGMVVAALSDEERRRLRVSSGGVRVEQVSRGPARAAGVRSGDVVLSLAGQEVDSPERFAEVAARLTPGSTVPMLVSREGAPSFMPLDIP